MNEALILWLALFALMSLIIIGAGVLLARSGDRIADRTGLGGLLIGMVLVAAATSLPEIAVAVSAVVEGSPDLAIGNLLGSNMANMALLAVVDIAYRGRVWDRVGSGHARTAAVATALTSVAVLAILRPFEVAFGWVGSSRSSSSSASSASSPGRTDRRFQRFPPVRSATSWPRPRTSRSSSPRCSSPSRVTWPGSAWRR